MTNDGRYYALGREVFRAPLRSPTGISMGFRVCICDEFVDGAAEEIANALNAADSKAEWDKAIEADRERNEA